MIRAIIFDFFGVIRTDGYNRWLKQHGFEQTGEFLTASERHDRGELSDADFFRALAEVSSEPVNQVESEMESGNELNQQLVDFIGTLRANYKIVLLSNSSSAYLRNELSKYDLEKYFDEIVISSEVGRIKPEPEIFNHIMRKLNMRPGECVFIDDNPKHVSAAEKLGIHSIIFTGAPSLEQKLQKLLK